MALINCPECNESISDKAAVCPKCGNPMKPMADLQRITRRFWRGYEWRTKSQLFGLPLVHIAIGRNKETGRLMVAKGIIAIGQFGIGIITIAQFGLGVLFGFGQFVGGIFSIGQFALGIIFGLGQFACGITAVGQIAFGSYVRAQVGFGTHVWSSKIKDYQAIGYFTNLWYSVKNLDILSVLRALLGK
jgi:hypothetical protein